MYTALMSAVIALGAAQAQGPVLSVRDTQFLLDGEPAFLLECSYYGGLGVADAEWDFLNRLK